MSLSDPPVADESASARPVGTSRADRAKGWNPRRDRVAALALAAAGGVAVLAAAARIPGAIRDAFWQDEFASAHVLIQSTPWGMLHQVARTEATPPLWYALGWVANQIGVSPQGFRGLSVLAGALLAGGTVLLAVRLLPVWASVLAGVLVAFGWQFVMHGRELRAYELFALTTLVFAWALLRARAGEPSSGWRRYALAAAVAAGSLTNYFFLLSVAAALLWLWLDPELHPVRRRLLRQIGLGLVPLAIWSPILVHQYLGQRFSWIGPFNVRGVIDVYWELFAHHLPSGLGGDILVPGLLLAAVLAGCALLARNSSEGRLLALLALTPIALSALGWLAGARVFDPRNLIGAGPFAAIALAALPTRLPRRLGYATALGAFIVMAVAVVQAERTPPTPYDKVSQLLVRQGWNRRDPIVLFGTFGDFFAYRAPLEWYLPHQPHLTLGEPERTRQCPAIYVLTQSPPVRAQILRSGLVASDASAAAVFVGELRARLMPLQGIWGSGHILAARNGGSACTRLVPESKIIPDLQR